MTTTKKNIPLLILSLITLFAFSACSNAPSAAKLAADKQTKIQFIEQNERMPMAIKQKLLAHFGVHNYGQSTSTAPIGN